MCIEFETIKEKIRFVSEYIQDSTADWLIVKQEIINAIPSDIRGSFQRREELTKKHKPLNEFETMVKNYWKELTGIELQIPKEKLLTEEPKPKPKSWPTTILLARKKKQDNYLKRKKM